MPRRNHLAAAAIIAGLALAGSALGQGTAEGTAPPSGPSIELAPGVTLEITDLRRQADKGVMELKFAVTNSSPADTSLKDLGLAYNQYLKDISIIDFAGKKQYNIGHAGDCLCSTFKDRDGGVVRTGERREFWAWYGLPPAGAKQVAVKIPDQQPIMNVPLR